MPSHSTTFDAWLAVLDICLLGLCGLGVADLPGCWQHWYARGLSPEVAARRVLYCDHDTYPTLAGR